MPKLDLIASGHAPKKGSAQISGLFHNGRRKTVKTLFNRGSRVFMTIALLTASTAFATSPGRSTDSYLKDLSSKPKIKTTTAAQTDNGKTVNNANGLKAIAEKFVKDNSGGSEDPAQGKLFPGLNSGNCGTRSAVMDGESARFTVDVAKAWFAKDKDLQSLLLDSENQAVVVVSDTQDESGVYVAVMNKKTGTGFRLGDKIDFVNVSYQWKQDTFKKFFPSLGDVSDVDFFDVISALLAKGAKLSVGDKGW